MTQIVSIYITYITKFDHSSLSGPQERPKTILGSISKVSDCLFQETQFEIASKGPEWNSHGIDKNEEMGFLLGDVSKEAEMKNWVNI